MSIPPNLRRYLPFILIAFFLLIILPALFRHSSTAGATPATQSTATLHALNLVDRGELAYQAAHGRYTPQLADLVVGNSTLAQDLTQGYSIELNVGVDGQSYYALVQSPVLSVLRGRKARALAEESCVVVKSESGVACPTTGASATKTAK